MFSSSKIVTNWKHRTHPFFSIYHQPEPTALQLSKRYECESWRIGVLLKAESSNDKQACTPVIASSEVQNCNMMDWQQKRTTAHNTTWTFFPSKLFQTDNTAGLTPCSGFTSNRNENWERVWMEWTSEWQGFTMLYPLEVIAWSHQLCAIKFAKPTCKSKWVQVQIKDRGIKVKFVQGTSPMLYDLQAFHTPYT